MTKISSEEEGLFWPIVSVHGQLAPLFGDLLHTHTHILAEHLNISGKSKSEDMSFMNIHSKWVTDLNGRSKTPKFVS